MFLFLNFLSDFWETVLLNSIQQSQFRSCLHFTGPLTPELPRLRNVTQPSCNPSLRRNEAQRHKKSAVCTDSHGIAFSLCMIINNYMSPCCGPMLHCGRWIKKMPPCPQALHYQHPPPPPGCEEAGINLGTRVTMWVLGGWRVNSKQSANWSQTGDCTTFATYCASDVKLRWSECVCVYVCVYSRDLLLSTHTPFWPRFWILFCFSPTL